MLPILEHRPTSSVLYDKGLTEIVLCHQCHVRLKLETEWTLCHLTELAHWQWPSDKPWMYLAVTDTFRSMLSVGHCLLPFSEQWLYFVDAKIALCEKCYRQQLNEIEDTCANTDYWPIVLAIRKRHEHPDRTEVQSPGLGETTYYPQILCSEP